MAIKIAATQMNVLQEQFVENNQKRQENESQLRKKAAATLKTIQSTNATYNYIRLVKR